MKILELYINLDSMRKLYDLTLSRVLDDGERAQLTIRVRLDGEPLGDGDIIYPEDMFKIIPEDEDLRPLSIEYLEIDPSQDEPGLVSGVFIEVDDSDDPENQIDIRY